MFIHNGGHVLDTNKIWGLFINDLKAHTSEISYNAFFEDLSLYKIDEVTKTFYLCHDDITIIRFIKERYIPNLEKSIKNVLDDNYELVIKTLDEYKNEKPEKKKIRKPNYEDNSKLFNPRFNFDNFVVGNNNRFAYSAAVAVAEDPGHAYNPLFLYSDSGLGKTHLMQAIGVHVIKSNPETNVLYVSSEMFTNELIMAIREKKMNTFKEKYRKIDVLLIDDIQFLEGKDTTQEEFFHTFNTLYESNKQIVISSDRPPNNLEKLADRLRSRFSFGLIADMQPADFETRIAILKSKVEAQGIVWDKNMEEVCSFIAEQVTSNVRELEGALNQVVGFSKLIGQEITLDIAKEQLTYIVSDNEKIYSPQRIRSTVAKYFKIKISDLDSPRRNASITVPRQIAMYICRNKTDMSLSEIGKIFGDRHYSTVINACDKIEKFLKSDEIVKRDMEEIDKILNSKPV